jgi:hypothetical protein
MLVKVDIWLDIGYFIDAERSYALAPNNELRFGCYPYPYTWTLSPQVFGCRDPADIPFYCRRGFLCIYSR